MIYHYEMQNTLIELSSKKLTANNGYGAVMILCLLIKGVARKRNSLVNVLHIMFNEPKFYLGFEVSMAVKIRNAFLWVITLFICLLCNIYTYFIMIFL